MKILLVEDDELLSNFLKTALSARHHVVDTARDGQEGWELVEAIDYDLVLLDIVLPKLDGLSFCRQLRIKGNLVLVLLLTAKGNSNDKVIGLDAGADDYVVKPVTFPELEARIRALLRRKLAIASPILSWGLLQLNSDSCEVFYNHMPLHLTAKEYGLVELFLRNSQRIYSQAAILNQLWSLQDEPPSEETVRAHMKRLRQKLRAVGAADLIETVYGLGYRLNANLRHREANFPPQQIDLPPEPACPPDRPALKEASFWQIQPQLLGQIDTLEQTVQAFLHRPSEAGLQKEAQRICHQLIGSLGLCGLLKAANLAQQLEELLQGINPLAAAQSAQPRSLQNQVSTLRDLVENAALSLDSAYLNRATENAAEKPVEAERSVELAAAQPGVSEQKAQLLIVGEAQEEVEPLFTQAVNDGWQVAIALNLQSAQQAIQRIRPDIVLLDLSPSAAVKLLEVIEQQKPLIPAVVITDGESNWVTVRKGRSLLRKPIAPAQILHTVTRILQPSKPVEAKILIVDDDRLTLHLLASLLTSWGMRVNTLNNPLQFWETLERVSPDLLVLDVQMPEISGLDLCRSLRNDSRWAWLPILFLTGSKDVETIQQVFEAGADDYVSKPVIAPELITRLLNRLERTRLLRNQSELDPLTQLPNRQRSLQELDRAVQFAQQTRQPFCLAVLEIDRLKQLNYEYGHTWGEQALRRVAQVLRQAFRPEDVVSLWDGAEFVVGLCGATSRESADWLTEILDQLQKETLKLPNYQPIRITFSAGISQYLETQRLEINCLETQGVETQIIQNLYKTASVALEKAKHLGSETILTSD